MFNEKEIKREEVKVEEKKVEPVKEETIEKPQPKVKPIQNKAFVVNVARLNIRSNPSDKADIVKTIAKGTELNIDIAQVKGSWSKVTSPVDGYVMTQFITPKN